MARIILYALVLIAIFNLGLAGASAGQEPNSPTTNEAAAKDDTTPEEAKIGEEAAKEIEKNLKPIEQHPELPRLSQMAAAIAKFTERPGISYDIKVVDAKAINALSLPGGRLYITQGAIDAAESEDELAAILAHEIAHNSLRHAMEQRERANRADLGLIAGIVAGILTNRREVALMATEIQQGALNHYGRAAELEADRHAIAYLDKTAYKPTAMLTVLEGLASIEESRPKPEILTTAHTHPLARERAREAEKILRAMGIDVEAERRQVTARFIVLARPAEIEGKEAAEILLNEKRVFAPAAKDDEATPVQRAEKYAQAMREAFRAGVQLIDLGLVQEGDDYLIKAQGETLIKVTTQDGELHNKSARELAEEAKKVIDLALYAEKVSRPF